MFRRGKFYKRLAIATLFTASAITQSLDAYAAPDSALDDIKTVNISAGKLGETISQLGELFDTDIAVSEDSIQGFQSPKIQGELNIENALREAISKTSLEFRITEDGAIIVFQPVNTNEEETSQNSTQIINKDIEILEVKGRRLIETGVGDNADFGILGQRQLVDTPFSISVFTEDLLENSTTLSLVESTRFDPGVEAGIPFNFVTIRGFDVRPETTLYDGQAGLQTFALTTPLALQRVEVFRGANTLVTGLTSSLGGIGGSVNYVPKRPEFDVKSITLGLVEDGYYIAGDFATRFGAEDAFGVRANLYRLDGNPSGRIFTEEKVESYNLYFDWKPNDDLYFSLDLSSQDNDLRGQLNAVFFALEDADGDIISIPRNPPEDIGLYPSYEPFAQSADRFLLKGRWQFADDWSIEIGYGEVDPDDDKLVLFGGEAFFIDSIGNAIFSPRLENFTREAESLQAVLRGRYFLGGIENNIQFGYSEVDFAGTTSESAFLNSISVNLFEGERVPLPPQAEIDDGLANLFRAGGGVESNKSIVAANESIVANDKLSVFAGFRYTEIVSNQDFPAFDFFLDVDQDEISPFGSLTYKVNEESSVYLTYTEALETGPSAPDFALNAQATLSPARAEQIELGFKRDFGNWLATAAIYEIDRPLAYVNESLIFEYNGRQINRGAELNIQGQMTENLRLVSGVSYLNAEIDDNGDPAVSGNEATGLPEFRFVTYIEYDMPAISGLTLTGNVRMQDGFFLDLQNFSNRKADGHTRLDLGVRYQFQLNRSNVTLIANILNVTDENYWTGDNFGSLYQGDPRSFRLAATIDF
ncbi:MAG: TonB-dependent receptor [Pseudomonadota bacterium]